MQKTEGVIRAGSSPQGTEGAVTPLLLWVLKSGSNMSETEKQLAALRQAVQSTPD